jgi:UDP-hydrolysing UDP-N-acetyl-D-glucosamine 2-epimerase
LPDPRKIAIFTGNRSEYGLQYPILRAIAADHRLDYYLLVGGAHLRQDLGATSQEIEQDGFRIHARVEIEPGPECSAYTAECIGRGILSISAILVKLQPDVLLIYGDRFESFAAMIAASQMNIPVAHIEGGDYTEGGALDDSVRHAMTKLAHLHFTTNAQSAERVLKLGEEPWRVFNVGLPTLDLAVAGIHSQPQELIAEFGLDAVRPIILFCQHSISTEEDQAAAQIAPSLDALRELLAKGYQVIATYPNDDAGGRVIIDALRGMEAEALPDFRVVKSLGRSRFHGMLHLIGRIGRGAMVGNSSAGIKETAAFACPAVNIGSRQQGRLRAGNVLDAGYDSAEILAAIGRCISDRAFRGICRTGPNPYGKGDAGRQVAEVLATTTLDLRLLQKKMTF